MLGGKDPVLIFQFSKLAPTVGAQLAKIPLVSQIPTVIEQPPIPIYLSEQFSQIMIDTEDKSVDLETDTETLSNGQPPDVNQKAIGTTISISMVAKKDSTAIILLSSLIDLVYEKATSKEYAISYLHGAITIFRGVLQSYSVSQNADEDKISIKLDLSKGQKNPTKPAPIGAVPGFVGPIPGG